MQSTTLVTASGRSIESHQEQIMKNLIKRFVKETEGQDLIEYALLAALIGLATTAAMTALSTSISTEFKTIGTSVSAAS
jgi:pilus assembly protein Flp/PilA